MKIVSILDTAIDFLETGIENIEKYQKEKDINLLKFRNDLDPTYFEIRILSDQEIDDCMKSSKTFEDLFLNCFKLGIEDIENLSTEEPEYEQMLEIGAFIYEASYFGAKRQGVIPQYISNILNLRIQEELGIAET